MMKEKFHELQEVFRVAEPVHKAAIQAAIDMYDEGESRPDINDELLCIVKNLSLLQTRVIEMIQALNDEATDRYK